MTDKRKDNSGTKGNKGGGRPTARKEMRELMWVLDRWIDENKVKEIQDKKEAGKTLSLREVYVLRAYNGSDAVLNKLSDKILPDKIDLSTKDDTFNTDNLTPEEKLAYVKIRLGLFQESKQSSTDGESIDLGDGQQNDNGAGKEA